MKQIIIVDDDINILDPMTIILEGAGYAVTAVSNGTSLLNREFTAPDIFIIDKQLSGVDGLDVCRFLKTQDDLKHIPVVMISASPNIHALAKDAMANEALEKPFKMKELRDMVLKHLGK